MNIAKIIFEATIGLLIIYIPAAFILSLANWPLFAAGMAMGTNGLGAVFIIAILLLEFSAVTAIYYFYMRNKIRN